MKRSTILLISLGMALAQILTLVPAVKQAALAGDFRTAERELAEARARRGVTGEYLEALSWIGRGQLAKKNYAAAEKNANEVRKECLAQLMHRKLDSDANLPIALGASIEVRAQALAEQGNRDQAVSFLREEIRHWEGTSIVARIYKNLNLLTLEGKPAPALETNASIAGETARPLSAHRNHAVLLFFWAHWCADCKVEIATVRRVNEAFGPRGLQVIAPTQHYGYVAGGVDAPAAAETAYIKDIWNKYYSRLGRAEVPISERNFRTYGVSTTPTMVLVDKTGIVRLYNPGKITYEELAARIDKLL